MKQYTKQTSTLCFTVKNKLRGLNTTFNNNIGMIRQMLQAKAAEIAALKETKGQLAAILGVVSAVGAVTVFLIILTVYGSIKTNLNTEVFDTGTNNLINLLPLVMVGAVIVAIVFGSLLAVIIRA